MISRASSTSCSAGDGGQRASRVLIFEPEAEGHQLEWLQHLVAHARTRVELDAMWIVAPRKLCDALQASILAFTDNRLRILSLSSDEERRCRHRNIAVGGAWRWWTMRAYLRRTGAQVGHFLQIDHLSLPLSMGLGFGGPVVGGILFRPSVHYAQLGPYRPDWRERIRDCRKNLLYRLMLRNRALSQVLSLDPHFPRFAQDRYGAAHKLRVLRDPAHPLVDLACDDNRLTDLPPANRVLFSLFGYLTERKGVLTLLNALRLLSPLRRVRTAVILAGRLDPTIRPIVLMHARALARTCPELWLRIVDRRISDGEITGLVVRSNVVLAPYQRFVGSSGVMLWAARAGRPVLTQEIGLMGRLTLDHGLGLVADTSQPSTLAEAMDEMIARGPATFFDPIAARLFVDRCTPDAFARTIIDSLIGDTTPMFADA